jgi:hypothetical protein
MKYAGDSGYGEALIVPLLNEFDNLIDILGESKFDELMRTICAPPPNISSLAGSDNEANTSRNTANAQVVSVLTDALRHEIIELIKHELGASGGTLPREKKPAEEAPVLEPIDIVAGPEQIKKVETLMRKGMNCVVEDLSTIISKKITIGNVDIKNIDSAGILSNTKDKFITLETERQDGLKLYARASAAAVIRISGIMAMVPDKVLDEKVNTLVLNQGDIDTVKEVCNQIAGSVSKVIKGDKFSLKQVVLHNEREKEELLFPADSGNYLSAQFTLGTEKEDCHKITLYINEKDITKIQ